MMNKLIVILTFGLCSIAMLNADAQTIEESCSILASDIEASQYHSFTLSGDGYLSYIWTDKKGSETTIKIDLTQITISKDMSSNGYRVWFNCIDAANCIIEQGIVGNDENYYAEYPKTYLPTKSAEGMESVFIQLEYLLKLSNEIR